MRSDEFRCVVCFKARRQIELRLDAAGAYRCRDAEDDEHTADLRAATPSPDPVAPSEDCAEGPYHHQHLVRQWAQTNAMADLVTASPPPLTPEEPTHG